MMDGTDRRGFLRGVFGGVTAAGLIVAASPSEVAAFASSVPAASPVVIDVPPPTPAHIGEHLYNEHGECIAIVTEVIVIRDTIDVTAFGDIRPVYVSGLPRVDIHARGLCELVWTPGGPPRLRGRR